MGLKKMLPLPRLAASLASIFISAACFTFFLAGGGWQAHPILFPSPSSWITSPASSGGVVGSRSDLPAGHSNRELLEYQSREGRRRLYHSFDLLSLNYDYMLANLKVFIYPEEQAGIHSFQASSSAAESENSQKVENFFFKSLSESNFVTDNPEEAVLYVLPISVDALWRDPEVGPGRVARHLRSYIQAVRTEHPFWNRSLGADHVLIACHDFAEDATRNYLELKKNVIWMDCFPFQERGHPLFYPHKDITLPPLPPADSTVSPGIHAPRVMNLEGRQSTLVFYGGGTVTGDALPEKVRKAWSTDPDFLVRETPALQSYRENLLSSKFCLTFLRQPYQTGLLELLQSGCVPVIVADGPLHDLPFQDIANWRTFSVLVRPQQVKKLKLLLQQISEEEYAEMQRLGAAFALHLSWNRPPQPGDAFSMLCYQLWVRRHSIRYVQRS